MGADPEKRRDAYRALFREAFPEATLAAIRHATNRAWPLGGDLFKEELARLTARRVAPVPTGRRPAQEPDAANQGVLPL